MRILVFFFLLFSFEFSFGQRYTVSGYVRDKYTGENLIGANVYIKASSEGTSTNTYGFYSITTPIDTVDLAFSYVGYKTQTISLSLGKDTAINVDLDSISYLQEIVVLSEPMETASLSSQMSFTRLSVDQIKGLPALLGETDVIKALQTLPGVQSGSEGSSGLYVRGGGPDQNLILLDGAPVHNASHLFGFFSVFNSDAINSVNLIKGGFPARYGGRLSSVVDITMKEGNKNEFHGEGSVGLISSKLTLEGPVRKGRASFLVSGRRTYIDALAYPLVKAMEGDSRIAGYYFYDLNGKINYRLGNKDHVYLSAYWGKDKAYSRYNNGSSDQPTGSYREEYGLQWGNITSALRWNRIINKKLFMNSMLTFSAYEFDLFEQYEEKINKQEALFYKGKYISGIEDLALKTDFDYTPSPNHFIRFGASIVERVFKPGAVHLQSKWEADSAWGSSFTYAKELAAYIENDHRINKRIKVNYGVHYSGFQVDGKYYSSLQPRLSSRILLAPAFSFKSSFADMTQYIHLLTNSGIGLPSDLWAPSTQTIKPQKSRQFAAGFAFNKTNLEVTVEGFYKTMDNLLEYKEGAMFLHIDDDWQSKVISGKGESYGIEVFAQKTVGGTTGWLGYTLSWANREFVRTIAGNQTIEKFPYKYDRRHDISLNLAHQIGKNVNLSTSWIFGSGAAITLPIANYISVYPSFSKGQEVWTTDAEIYGKRNGYRMRDYHRLDVSASFKKDKKWGEREWTLGLYNAYNRKNPFFIDIGRNKKNYRSFIQHSLFPIIPSISYRYKF